MRSPFSRSAKRSRRRREVFAAQFDGGQSAVGCVTHTHLGCDGLERRMVLTASPAAEFDFSQGTITGYQGAGGAVEIPAAIGWLPVVVIANGAFANGGAATNPITSIVIPDSVVIVGFNAFGDNSALTSVVIGKGVTEIRGSAFAANPALTSVTIGGHVTSIGGASGVAQRVATVVT